MSSAIAWVVLGLGVPLNAYVTFRLFRLSRSSLRLRALRERAIVAAAVLVVVLVFGLVFVNNDMAHPVLAGDATKLITRLAILAVATIPATYWLLLYR